MNPLQLMAELYEVQLGIYRNPDMAAVATALIINNMLEEQRHPSPCVDEDLSSPAPERLAA